MLNIPDKIKAIVETLKKANFQAFLVGGCVRDLILGRTPKDWDIATDATPEQITPLFTKTVYENEFGTVAVIDEAEPADSPLRQVEITPFRLESSYSDQRHPDQVAFSDKIEDDLARRDFTINALALDVANGQVIDLYDGQRDLKDKLLRTVGIPDARFQEDALRLMRAVRLATELGLAISEEVATSIQNNAHLLAKISRERVRDEFTKIVLSASPIIGFTMLQKLGLLTYISPELEKMIHVEQGGEHIYDVWEHSLRALQHAADKGYTLEVRLAALFHDIGKPPTRRPGKAKTWTFYGHEVVGAKITKGILNSLKFPVKMVTSVTTLVRNHMFFADPDKITLSAVRRIIAKVGREEIWRLMEVRIADRIGMGRPKEEPYRLRKYQSMIEEALRAPTSVGMLKINGGGVMAAANIAAGPKIGHILHALFEEVLENPDKNTEDYLQKRAQELAILPDNELKQLGEAGREKKDEVEEGEIQKLRAKFHVK